MDIKGAAAALSRHYPRIYFACHRRHVKDPKTAAVLSARQASILDHLDSVEPTFVSALAEHMGVTPSTMSLSLDRLESAGYVRRKPDPVDSRRVGVVLSAAGERIRSVNSVLDPRLVEQLMAQLDASERREAIGGLGLLAQAADRVGRDVRNERLADTPASSGERK